MSRLVNTAEAAEILGVSSARIRQFIKEGRLMSLKLGRDHLIESIVLQQFAASGRKKTGRPQKGLR